MIRIRAPALYAALSACIASGVSGCSSDVSYLRARVADPSEVRLIVGGATVLPTAPPEETQPRDVTIARGSRDDLHGGSANYELHARRDEHGAIVLEWKTSLHVLYGVQGKLVAPDGELGVEEGHEEGITLYGRVTPATLDAPNLRLEACPRLEDYTWKPDSFAPKYKIGYLGLYWGGCGEEHAEVPFVLETPWSNVVELHKHRGKESRQEDVFWGLLALGGIAGPGAWMTAAPSSVCSTDKVTDCRIAGGVVIGLGALLALPFIIDFFRSRPGDEVVFTPRTVGQPAR
jgi:hypothetical protein